VNYFTKKAPTCFGAVCHPGERYTAILAARRPAVRSYDVTFLEQADGPDRHLRHAALLLFPDVQNCVEIGTP
jgi:hypothetical protein